MSTVLAKAGPTAPSRGAPVASSASGDAMIRELVVDDRIDALNATFAQHGIDAGAVVAIVPLPSAYRARPTTPQLRVFYRSA